MAFWKGTVVRFIVVQAATLKKKRKSRVIQQEDLTVTITLSVFLPKWLCAKICVCRAIQHSHFPGHTHAVSALCQRGGTNHSRDTQCLNAACMAPVSSHMLPVPKREGSITSSAAAHLYNEVFPKHPESFFCGNRKQDFIDFIQLWL